MQENNLDEESSSNAGSSESSNISHFQEDNLDETHAGDTAEVPVSPPIARQRVTTPRAETPRVAPRRSTRPTKKPNWMGTGEFAMPISAGIPEWERRVNYLNSLLEASPECVRTQILTTIVNIISSQT